MPTLHNPILPGFNADPSICRVGADYYIATSTFEWYPGVQIHQSRDLCHWYLIKRPLERATQLDMRGNPDSCGVWAPSLSFADGLFWLVYTDVKRYDGNFKDAHNYIVTAERIDGPWSDPIYANSSGFDPSLFHDSDGRRWFVNMIWNHRASGMGTSPDSSFFGGIVMQEFDQRQGALVGPIKRIYDGTDHGGVEAPHLFKRNDCYYLTVAEGGTGYDHAITLARSDDVWGPYKTHPERHLLTSKDHPEAALQRAGHGQYVESPEGDAYFTHLCSRPLQSVGQQRRSPCGRETALQACVWGEDGWLRLRDNAPVPALTVEVPDIDSGTPLPGIEPGVKVGQPSRHVFSTENLPLEFQWLRTPEPGRLFSLTENPGSLRLYGRESIGSWFEQSLVARRQEHHRYTAETTLSFAPSSYQHSAGLTAYYNRHKFHFLCVTWDEHLGRCLSIMSCLGDYPESRISYMLDKPIALPQDGVVGVRVVVSDAVLQFYYALASAREQVDDWIAIGPQLDASLLSDEAGRGEHASFTGAFVGMMAFDTSGTARSADFHHFAYTPEL